VLGFARLEKVRPAVTRDGPKPGSRDVRDLQGQDQAGDASVRKQNPCPRSADCRAAPVGYPPRAERSKGTGLVQV